VEDSKPDALLIREAIKSAAIDADLHFVQDGEKATDFFDAADEDDRSPCPNLLLLDLNLPKKSGTEVLTHMRSSRKCKGTKVLIVTSSDSPRDREAVAALGANEYFRKPSGYPEFLKLGELVKRLLEEVTAGGAGR
jgi:DNA-binding response OmpR family regulator